MQKKLTKTTINTNNPNFFTFIIRTELPFKDLELSTKNYILFDSRNTQKENLFEYQFDLEISYAEPIYYFLFLNYPKLDNTYELKEKSQKLITYQHDSFLQILFTVFYKKPKFMLKLELRSYPDHLAYYLPSKIEINHEKIIVNFLKKGVFVEIPKEKSISFNYSNQNPFSEIKIDKQETKENQIYSFLRQKLKEEKV